MLLSTTGSCLHRGAQLNNQRSFEQSHRPCPEAPSNFGVKLSRPGFGPAAELPACSPA
jgi:hypothetical protein